MEKERLVQIINNPGNATLSDYRALEELINVYPYSQILHILLAKTAYLLDLPEKSDALKTAALYASHRASLKKVIEEADYPGFVHHIFPYQELPVFETFTESNTDETVPMEDDSPSSSIFKEVMRNLEKLKALREQFQFLELSTDEAEETPKVEIEKKESKKVDESPKLKAGATSEKTKADTRKKPTLQVITPMEQRLDSQVNEFFLSEIQKKNDPATEDSPVASNLQSDLIEKFIKAQPTIGSIKKEIEKDADEVVRDLSERSTRFGDNLISENLAIILLRQGKKDRAIEIYKKLIWKLPQKKAYFAARIEEIKK